MTRKVNPVSVSPNELKPGDVMVVKVTCHIMGTPGNRHFRIYRCPENGYEHDGIPQGDRVINEQEVARALFPVATWMED